MLIRPFQRTEPFETIPQKFLDNIGRCVRY